MYFVPEQPFFRYPCGRYCYAPRVAFGQQPTAGPIAAPMVAAPAPAPANEPPSGEHFTLADLGAAIKKVTPAVLILGIATGFAFALGNGIASKYVLKR